MNTVRITTTLVSFVAAAALSAPIASATERKDPPHHGADIVSTGCASALGRGLIQALGAERRAAGSFAAKAALHNEIRLVENAVCEP